MVYEVDFHGSFYVYIKEGRTEGREKGKREEEKRKERKRKNKLHLTVCSAGAPGSKHDDYNGRAVARFSVVRP